MPLQPRVCPTAFNKQANSVKSLQARAAHIVKPTCSKHFIFFITYNGRASFKNVNNCLNTNIYSYFETSGVNVIKRKCTSTN